MILEVYFVNPINNQQMAINCSKWPHIILIDPYGTQGTVDFQGEGNCSQYLVGHH